MLGLCFLCIFYLKKFFSPHRPACGILVTQPGIKPVAPAVRVPSLNHWTTREFP